MNSIFVVAEMRESASQRVTTRIEDHGIIGNLATVALVSIRGTIDFACFPRFDSPTVFAELLDTDGGGEFSIAPVSEPTRVTQMYVPDTNVLMTRFSTSEGIGELTDYMPLTETGDCGGFRIVRHLRVIKGTVAFRVRCAPRFDYARSPHSMVIMDTGVRFVPEGSAGALLLHSHYAIEQHETDACVTLTLRTGQSTDIILEEEACPGDAQETDDYSLSATVRYWQRWAARSTYRGRWREKVMRSALTLKLLMSREYGSLIAAATFGLPEVIGGERNWDYRYSWIRDAAFTVYAFMNLGYTEEASAFVDWVEARCSAMHRDGSMQIMYGIDGRSDLADVELSHFRGHRDSRPLTIGNQAFEQLQLDIYGALLDSVCAINSKVRKTSIDAWRKLTVTVEYVCTHWNKPDGGIWEFRNTATHFLYSRLMCWVALDRAYRLAVQHSLPAPLARWASIRDEIQAEIVNDFWDEEQQSFVQSRGSKALDGSTFLMTNLHFIAPSDPRWRSTMKAIEEQLVEEPLVYRYRSELAPQDHMKGKEGAFVACSFWYVEALARGGETEKARLMLERLFCHANHLDLYAEEIGECGEQLGNFPQALSHLTLIMAAVTLDRALDEQATA